ncbi:thiazole biosynthesis adenylyltransferase ThiF [Metabacillus iocasae]|uniref:Molybdopterin/thiamine biosynthesis adenylyltransferase n=1 Tax=Priestia iocasae TaxID=2291674 RepID=A0ABS2QTB4_9BACI|nr:thiazole biosynthesis adenylyltransferase ThiF [Metabacillus iocasae]MBM7702714.1 molybdopterin/thiamine biosynthesis adenylyltransferase [Metabacillus iocasae]
MSERYSRQELFQSIGKEGQRKLREKHVLIIGAGALGTGNAEALVRAGVGKVTIVDRDYVEWSNLQRQQLYSEQDAMKRIPKAIAAQKRLGEINGEVEIVTHVMDVGVQELGHLIKDVDVMIDATDNFDSRLMMNDIAQKHHVPWIYGACVGSYGISYTILPQKTPCLSCLLESVPIGGVTCDTGGIISSAVQMVVTHQVTEALKLLVEDYEALRHQLVSFDVWKNEYRTISVHTLKRENCQSCGQEATYPFLHYTNQTKVATLCGRNTVQIRPRIQQQRNLQEIHDRFLKQGYSSTMNPYLVSIHIEDYRIVLFQDGRVLIHGTNDMVKAKSLYYQYII